MNKYQKSTTKALGLASVRVSLGGFLSACAALLALITPFAKAQAVNWEDFDTVAGIGMTITIDELSHLEGRAVTFTVTCNGVTLERQADVDGGDAELILFDKDVERAGVCSTKVRDHQGKEVASGSFEIFPDVPTKWDLLQVSEGDLLLGEESELKAGYFDKFRNSIRGRLVLVSGDGNVERRDEDDEGYLHFLFTPEEVGETKLKLLDTFTDESRTFTFEVLDPNPPPVAAAPAQGRGDAVTLLLGQLIRASLLDEYGVTPAAGEAPEDRGYSLVDSFDVEIGDNESTLHVNEQYDLLITALDRRGKRVQNYVDRVIVETSDPDAIVPTGTIRFKATDRGQKVLSLAVMFQTPGEQTVTIRDEADPEEIFGKTSVWVLGQTSTPINRSIVINEKSGTVAGSRVSISGTAPAYTNLQLFTVDGDSADRELAITASDAEGKFRFEITLEGGQAHTLFVRDPEERVKDSEKITLTVDATSPVLRSAVLTPSTVAPEGSFTVSVEAETNQRAFAALPNGAKIELLRKSPSEEAGFDVYESTLTALGIEGQHAVAITIADNAGNETVETRMLTVTIASVGLPVVQNLRADAQNQDVLLSWSHVQGAVRYRVYFGSAPVNLESFVDTKGATASIRLTGLTGGQATFFAVTALGNNGEESTEKSTVVSAAPRGSLFELSATSSINGALLRWVALPGMDIVSYRIRYGVQAGLSSEERVVPANMLEYGAQDLINGVMYYFSLEAMRTNGELLKDTMEVAVTPGQNGMPGLSVGPLDPLPLGIGGSPDASHGVAPAHVPESGFPLLLWMILAGAIGGGFFGLRSFKMWKVEREFLASFQR